MASNKCLRYVKVKASNIGPLSQCTCTESVQEKLFKSKDTLVGWLYLQAHFGCHDTLMLGRSPIKSRQHPDMTIAVGWDAKRIS